MFGIQYLSLIQKLLLATLSFCAISSSLRADLILADGGVSSYSIVVAKDAIPSETKAASELQKYLKEVTGAELPIIGQEKAEGLGRFIYVGDSPFAREALPEVPWSTIKPDDIVIKTKGDALFLSGGRPRGSIYATYQFLEDVVGCEWWTSETSTIPKKDKLEIAPQDIVYSPPSPYRFAYYADFFGKPEYGVRMKQNGISNIPEELGGHVQVIGWCHTFATFLPPAKYFEKHPEWGALYQGKRLKWTQTDGQLCLSNPALVGEMTKAVLEKLAAQPEQKVVSVSANDNYFRCECAGCLAIEKQMGSSSGPLISFVNAVAREVKKTRPDALIHTLAYIYTFKPPQNIKLEDNVLVAVCTYTGKLFHPFSDQRNAFFTKNIETWAGLSKQMFFWDYNGDYNDAWKVRPNIFVIAPNIRYFAQFHPWGIFSQGVSFFEPKTDFQGLRLWLTTHLQWNPQDDEVALMKRYLNGYYGAAGPALYDYLAMVNEEAQKLGDRIIMQGDGEAVVPYPPSFFTKAGDYFDQAEKAVAIDPVLLNRVKTERLAVDYSKLDCYVKALATPDVAKELFATPQDAVKACGIFLENVKLVGIDPGQLFHYAWGSTSGIVAILKRIIDSPIAPLPKMFDGQTVVDHLVPNLYWNGTKWEGTVDRKAGGMFVLKIPNNSPRTQGTLGPEVTEKMEGKKWKVYAILRYQGEGDGAAEVGIFDRDTSSYKTKKIVPLKSGAEYEAIEIGSMKLNAMRDLVFVKPVADPKQNGALFLQRFVFVEAK